MVGQVFSLQIGSPATVFTSWMTWSIPCKRRYCSTTVHLSAVGFRSIFINCRGTETHTLMSQPFAQFHILRTGTESQKVSLHIQWHVFLLEKVFWGVVMRHRSFNREVRLQRGRNREWRGPRRTLLRVSYWGLWIWRPIVYFLWIVVIVLVVTSSAKPLAAVISRWWSVCRTRISVPGEKPQE
jgi:hypothetical protein